MIKVINNIYKVLPIFICPGLKGGALLLKGHDLKKNTDRLYNL